MVKSNHALFDNNVAPPTGDTTTDIAITSRTNTILPTYTHNVVNFADPTLKAPILDKCFTVAQKKTEGMFYHSFSQPAWSIRRRITRSPQQHLHTSCLQHQLTRPHYVHESPHQGQIHQVRWIKLRQCVSVAHKQRGKRSTVASQVKNSQAEGAPSSLLNNACKQLLHTQAQRSGNITKGNLEHHLCVNNSLKNIVSRAQLSVEHNTLRNQTGEMQEHMAATSNHGIDSNNSRDNNSNFTTPCKESAAPVGTFSKHAITPPNPPNTPAKGGNWSMPHHLLGSRPNGGSPNRPSPSHLLIRRPMGENPRMSHHLLRRRIKEESPSMPHHLQTLRHKGETPEAVTERIGTATTTTTVFSLRTCR